MRSIVALLLACWMLGGSVVPGFGAEQSAHWGDLLLHYQQHRKTDPGLSFVSFLEMHYGADSEHHKHPAHSHHNLPSAGHAQFVQAPGAIRLAAPLAMPAPEQPRTAFFRKADLYSYLLVFAMINPPQR